jgi:Tfp pilus assembly protein PilF
MFNSFRLRFQLFVLPLLLWAAVPAHAQFGQVEGDVFGPDGAGVQNAVIGFEISDYNLHTEVNTDKKGHFFASVRSGDHKVTLKINGNLIETRNVHVFPGRQSDQAGALNQGKITFRLEASGPSPATSDGSQPAPAAGQSAGQSAEQAAAAQRRQEQLAKRDDLTKAVVAGQTALQAKQYDQAIQNLLKASEIDPKQIAVWQALADAYMGASRKKSPESAANQDKAADAFRKAIELEPTLAGTYNNFALALAETGKLDEAKQNLAKAIELDPPGAGKYYFNLGTLLVESGQAGGDEQFRKATQADPNYAEAWYQYGVALAGKATVDGSGKMIAPAGSVEALRKYLALKPTGPNAESAKEMIAAFGK